MASNSLVSNRLRVHNGILKIPSKGKTAKVTLTVNTRIVDVFKMTNADIKFLESISVDVSNPSCKSTKSSNGNSKYCLTFQLNVNVDSIMKELDFKDKVVRPSKLQLFKRGAFIETAGSRVNGQKTGSKGILIISMPTTFKGGEISFPGGPEEEMHSSSTNCLKFMFCENNCDYSLKKISSGHRVLCVYDVFDRDSTQNLIEPEIVLDDQLSSENLDSLLQEAENFCKKRKNILFGFHKYNNEIFVKLLAKLKQKYKVIKVKSDNEEISGVETVYVLDGPCDDCSYDGDSSEPDLEELATESYNVEHVLFPSVSKLKDSFICGFNSTRYYQSQKRDSGEFSVDCWTGYLINPSTSPEEKKMRF